MIEKTEGRPKKKPWVEPQVERILLDVEEQLVMYCKRGGRSGPMANNCAPGQGCPKQGGS
jgi:hypothetical protein